MQLLISAGARWGRSLVLLAALGALLGTAPAVPAASDGGAQRILHMLDYIAVDYPEAVERGQVINKGEYAEMLEFAEQVQARIGELPTHGAREQLVLQAGQLHRQIQQRATTAAVARQAQQLRGALTRAYGVATAPVRAPDLALGERLYQDNCASCHGAAGHGDGPQSSGLVPAPTDFTDWQRARERSVFGLYNAISLGVEETPMRAFDELTAEQRWALAFYVGNFAFSDAQRSAGAAHWQDNTTAGFTNLASVTERAPAQVAQQHGETGVQLMAYLRRDPGALATAGVDSTPLQTARAKINESLVLYRAGKQKAAYKTALAAYLDGFELAEANLETVAPELLEEIEHGMLEYRQQIKAGAPVTEVAASQQALDAQLAEAERLLSETRLGATTAFVSAFVILLREGLEAILILAAVASVLIRTGRRDALPYVHFGWVGALVLGVGTWAASSYIIEISGAGREVTEGVTALLAAVVLLYVGLWLHDKSHAQRWQQFVRERIQRALHGRALWVLALIAFLAVYREVFETVLFYQALWMQAGAEAHNALWSGMIGAAALLLALTWVILRSSLRLPLRAFFTVNAAIMLVLAVAFAGHGIAGLQEAGVLPTDTILFPEFSLLGIYPTKETLIAQAVIIGLVVAVMIRERRTRATQGV